MLSLEYTDICTVDISRQYAYNNNNNNNSNNNNNVMKKSCLTLITA